MRFVISLFFIIFSQSIQAQNFVPIDTSNVTYRKNLKTLYSKRVSDQSQIFQKQITNPKVRKEVGSIYKEVTDGFKETIDKGYFVEDSLYRNELDKILKNLKNNNPDYASLKTTQILLSYGTAPNAYAIGNDIVVVYIPLLKKIRNQYELAYIISHEIAHNILKHSYNGMIANASLKQSEDLIKKTKELKKQKYNRAGESITLYKNLIYGSSKNKRKLEQEADSLGFILFKNAYKDYQYEVVKTLELLEIVDKETDSLSVEDYVSLFETEQLPFKKEWIVNGELESYKYDTTPKFWTIDSLKTHPDCKIRAEFIKTNFEVQENKLQEASEEFKTIQFASKYNDVLGLYVIEEYGKSLYETLLLLKWEPENQFLRNLVSENLLKIQSAQKSYTLDRHLDRLNPRNSDSYNTFLYFIRELRRKEMDELINLYKA
ncbi:hypothetical protein EI546_13390 [Aequorivita sp. H23M31]|uniref:Peptidase M48 domain-containing protein n=1 Tax=Aequorivita ciconiae TaxID=2494375 RepID=A0A410G5Y1_9FLAO|nr:M48 family metalloprotease [Aequorivita sp. H23M31]QAA82650.1 hypothetical protein EI546_13390 [Aequorivita sp. H23M31]